MQMPTEAINVMATCDWNLIHDFIGQCELHRYWTAFQIGSWMCCLSLRSHRTEIATISLEWSSVPLRIIFYLGSCHSIYFQYYSLQYRYTVPLLVLDLVDASHTSCYNINMIDPCCVLLTCCIRSQSYTVHIHKYQVTGFCLLTSWRQ